MTESEILDYLAELEKEDPIIPPLGDDDLTRERFAALHKGMTVSAATIWLEDKVSKHLLVRVDKKNKGSIVATYRKAAS